MSLAFKQVDVFSSLCRGHPVCVFLESRGLSTKKMELIANWTNFPETTFVSSSKKADYCVKIFTCYDRVPFEGPPTLATAWALMESGILKKEVVIQDCDYGLVEVFREEEKLFFTLPKFEILNSIDHTLMKEAIGIDLHEDCCVIQTGGPECQWIIGAVKNPDDLSKIHTRVRAFYEYIPYPLQGITVYAIKDSIVRLRSFHYWNSGPSEIPLSGSGNIAVAVHIKTSGRHKITGNTYQASQGEFLHQGGDIFVRMGDCIQIGGVCRTIFSGTSSVKRS